MKVAVGVGAATALGAGAFAVRPALFPPRTPPADVRYLGAHRTGGPALRGVPYVPIAIRDGAFVGTTTAGSFDTLAWLRYCGHGDLPGLRADFAGDEVLRYHMPDEIRGIIRPWYRDREGEPIRPEDFPGDGFAARFAWRGSGNDAITGVLLKTAPDDVRFPDAAWPIHRRPEGARPSAA